MAFTADVLRSMLKANLHGDTSFADPGDLNNFLTLAQQKIVALAPSVLGVKIIAVGLTTVAGTRDYALAADFFQMYGMYVPSQNRQIFPISWQDYINEVERFSSRPQGPPEEYCVTEAPALTDRWTVRLNPEPDAVYTVAYAYYAMPADVSGSAIVPVSQIGFGEALLWCATWLARERNDPEGAASAQAIFEREMRIIYDHTPQPEYTYVVGPRFARQGSTLRLPSTYPDI